MRERTDRPFDPFARTAHPAILGDVSSIADTMEEENAKIASLIPAEATIDAGIAALHNMAPMQDDSQKVTSIFNIPRNMTPPEPDPVEEPEPVKEPEPVAPAKEEEDEVPPEFTDEDVLPLLDALLTQGCAKYTFNIKGIEITLRSQFLWEDQMLMDYMDKQANADMNLKATGSFYFEVYSLATNIERIGGTYFPCITYGKPEELVKSYEDRVNFLKTLPSAFVTMITMKRIDFLKRVQYVVTNFERLIKVF
jgi:hypothetical protein